MDQGVWQLAGRSDMASEGYGAGKLQAKAVGGRDEPRQAGAERRRLGKSSNPGSTTLCGKPCLQRAWRGERRVFQLVDQPRSTQRYQPTQRGNEK